MRHSKQMGEFCALCVWLQYLQFRKTYKLSLCQRQVSVCLHHKNTFVYDNSTPYVFPYFSNGNTNETKTLCLCVIYDRFSFYFLKSPWWQFSRERETFKREFLFLGVMPFRICFTWTWLEEESHLLGSKQTSLKFLFCYTLNSFSLFRGVTLSVEGLCEPWNLLWELLLFVFPLFFA